LGPEDADLGTAFNLAEVYRAQGRYADAEAYYQRALGIWQQALGPHHPLVAIAFDNLAQLHYAQARFAEAEPLYARPRHPRKGSSGR
jgi:tetratricopeptide (TPR) repeat protein